MSGFCIHCGSHLSPAASFCDACGQAVLPPEGDPKASQSRSEGVAPEKISKLNPWFAVAAMGALVSLTSAAAMLWPKGDGASRAVALKNEETALTTIMGRWAATQDGTVAQYEFAPETMTTLGHTFAVTYAPQGNAVSVGVGSNPSRELAKLIVVTHEKIRLEGAASVTLYRIH